LNKQLFYAAFFCAFAAAMGCNKSSSSTPETVATVDGSPITAEQFNKFLQRMPTIKVRTQNGQVVDAHPASPPGFQAVQALIEQNLLLQIAKDEGVSPTDKEVEDEITFHRNLDPNYVSNLQKQGLSMQDIRDSIRIDVARFKVMTRGITVSSSETDDFIKTHPKQFSSPPSANLLWIVADDKHKKDADQELASGSPFSSVASHYSQDPKVRQFEGKYNNGQAPITVISQMPPLLQKLVDATPELKATNWVKDRNEWIKFFVQSKTGSKLVAMNEYKKKAVQQALMLQKAAQAAQASHGSDLETKLMAKMRSAAVQINIEPYPQYWKREQQELVEQQASQAGGPGAAPGSAGNLPASPPSAKPKH
jgi:hypothetical protein